MVVSEEIEKEKQLHRRGKGNGKGRQIEEERWVKTLDVGDEELQ